MIYEIQMSMLVKSYTIAQVEANTKEEAIKKAKQLAKDGTVEWCDSTEPYHLKVESFITRGQV